MGSWRKQGVGSAFRGKSFTRCVNGGLTLGESNFLLKNLLEEAGVSHSGLASRMNRKLGTRYDHASVARWIRDRAVPRHQAPEVICTILSQALKRPILLTDIGMRTLGHAYQRTDNLAGAVNRATALWAQDTKHPDFLASVEPFHGAEAIVPVFEWENSPGDLDVARKGNRAVGVSDLVRFQMARQRYQEMYRLVGGVPVRGRISAFLSQQVAPVLLQGSYSDAVGRKLFQVAGSLTALAGVCAYDASRQALAQRYFLQALRMAKASGDRSLGGYVVALMSNQAMSMRQYQRVVQYANTALHGTRGGLSPALRADLYTMQSRAFARLGDRVSCHTHMARAENLAGRIRLDEEPDETSYVQVGLVETQLSEALRQLGDLTAAERYAAESVRTANLAHSRGQVHRYAGLAIIRIQRSRVDEALPAAWEMLRRAGGMESVRLNDRVRSVRDAFARRSGEPEIRDFIEQADAQLMLQL